MKLILSPILNTGLAILLTLPLLFKVPYLISAWRYSPLDQKDIWFWLVALILGIFLWRLHAHDPSSGDSRHDHPCLSGIALLVSFGLWLYFIIKDVNTLALAAGILIAAMGLWLCWGWRSLENLLPVFFWAGLGCPSSTYWLEFYAGTQGITGISGFWLKLLLGIIFLGVWWLVRIFLRKTISPHAALFALAMALSAVLLLTNVGELPPGQSGKLNLMPRGGDWVGKTLSLTPVDLNFFSGCQVQRYLYCGNVSWVSVLMIRPGTDIHQIHPIGICLKSSGWQIISQQQQFVTLGKGKLQVECITAALNGQRYLIYSWFTDGTISTGNFKQFRQRWQAGQDWTIVQLMTPMVPSLAAAQQHLTEFIMAFR